MLIEYDHASGLTPTQRLDSLVASVQRALEELEEAKAELEVAEAQTNNLWEHIKSNYDGAGCAETVMKFAINAACEAIQVAAMCQKFLEMENRA